MPKKAAPRKKVASRNSAVARKKVASRKKVARKRPTGKTTRTSKRSTKKSNLTALYGATDQGLELSDSWKLSSAKLDGKSVTKSQLKGARLCFSSRGHFVVTVGDQVLWRGQAQFKPEEGPYAVDIIHTQGEKEGTVFRAICKIDGDTHWLCSAPPGGERPADFESGPGTGNMLQVWRREG